MGEEAKGVDEVRFWSFGRPWVGMEGEEGKWMLTVGRRSPAGRNDESDHSTFDTRNDDASAGSSVAVTRLTDRCDGGGDGVGWPADVGRERDGDLALWRAEPVHGDGVTVAPGDGALSG